MAWAYARELIGATIVADTPGDCAEGAMAVVVERLGQDWFGTNWPGVDWAEWADVVDGLSIHVVPA
jgi:hypothetical protein